MAVVATEPIDRSKPPTTSVAVTPSASTPVIATDWNMNTAACGEAKPSVASVKKTINPRSRAMKPYFMAKSRRVMKKFAFRWFCFLPSCRAPHRLPGDLGKQPVDVDLRVTMLADDRVLRHHENTVGCLQCLVELGAEDQRRASGSTGAQLRCYVTSCRDVD